MIMPLMEYFQPFVYMIMSLMLLYVLYRIVRLADILDTVKRGFETNAKSASMEAEINLALMKQIAEIEGVDITEPAIQTRTEGLAKRLKDAKARKRVK